MGKRSNIEMLPDEIKQRLRELLHDPRLTQEEIAEIINEEMGDSVVSKSGVNRYAVKMKEFEEKNRQAREVADMYLSSIGDKRQGKLGKVINEQVRMLSFELLMNIEDVKERAGDPKSLANLADVIHKISRSIKDLESAATTNMERERKLQEAAKAVAEEVETTTRKAGLSDQAVAAIRNKILGITNG